MGILFDGTKVFKNQYANNSTSNKTFEFNYDGQKSKLIIYELLQNAPLTYKKILDFYNF